MIISQKMLIGDVTGSEDFRLSVYEKALWKRDICANSLWQKGDYIYIVERTFQAEKTASSKALEQELEKIFTEK